MFACLSVRLVGRAIAELANRTQAATESLEELHVDEMLSTGRGPRLNEW
jgi:hypothetical protein